MNPLDRMGADLIAVADNGTGINSKNYKYIGLKHHTSKLTEFDDLNSLTSYGFRGEAINALCELSEKVSLTTKQKHQDIGNILNFSRNGE